MTRRRPSNKKPTGLNKSLGNSLSNERDRVRKSHQRAKYDGNEEGIENPAFTEKEVQHNINSITDETSLEEFLAKAELAGTDFTAEKQQFHIVERNAAMVVPTKLDLRNNIELQRRNEYRLRIPRRPKDWETVEELTKMENETFLRWRSDLNELQELDGLVLTPFERNPDMWRELWRVIEKSDIIVQIVDARNPLLFRSKDLDDYIKEVDPVKQTLLLVNKADLLRPEQLSLWVDYFDKNHIKALFWSALDEMPTIDEEEKEGNISAPSTSANIQFASSREQLINYLKEMGRPLDEACSKPIVVGMVGYPNVGKSSTINKLAESKKVSVSATPGKTRHFQTIHIDKQLCLCDCPGLVMPSFSFGRSEMFLNGILPIDQMRDHFSPTALLLSRVPIHVIESMYSVMLPSTDIPSAFNLLTSLAYMRGFMSSAGVPDCSRAARLLLKDVVKGKLLWVASPPGYDQEEFDTITYPPPSAPTAGKVQLEKLSKLQLLEGDEIKRRILDAQFFSEDKSSAHVKNSKTGTNLLNLGTVIPRSDILLSSGKKHFNRNKKEKLRRLYNE